MTVWLRLLLLASVPLATKLGMTIPVRESCSIVFAGDMMQHSAQIESAHRDGTTYYYKDCFSGIAPLVREADIAVCNLETPLGGAPYSGYPAFCAPDEFASAIHEAGFDVMLTANNHCLDRGDAAFSGHSMFWTLSECVIWAHIETRLKEIPFILC